MLRTYRSWLWAAVAWVFLAGICLLELWPEWPETRRQWALLVVAGPPLYILLEWLAGKLIAPTNEQAQNHSSVSLRRILVLLLRFAVFLAVVWGVVSVGRAQFGR